MVLVKDLKLKTCIFDRHGVRAVVLPLTPPVESRPA